MKPHFVSFLKIILCLFALCGWQGAYATPTTPTSDFIDNGNGTVTHKKTGLTWQRCAVGQTWNGGNCSGEAKTFGYHETIALKSDFAGKSDWRVPNVAELQRIVERENLDPAINTLIFPDTPSDAFLSSSPYFSTGSWGVSFSRGDVFKHEFFFPVRLVRGGQPLTLGLYTPNIDFVDNGDGTVTHKTTGLMWQRCAVGQTWTGSICSGTASEVTYDDALALTSNFAGHSDWQLPDVNELVSIVEYNQGNPAINETQFPNTPSIEFWSSLPVAGFTDVAWRVNFDYGSSQHRLS